MFGFTQAELLGRNISYLMPEPFRSEHDRYIEKYVQTSRAKIIGIGREVIAKRKDGTMFPAYLSVGEMQIGKNRKFTGILRDMTLQKKVEQDLFKLEKEKLEIEISSRLKSEFLTTISHEIRTPLNSVLGLTELLLERNLPSEQHRMLTVVRSSSEHLLHLINDILDLSLIETGNLKIENIPFNLAEQIQICIDIANVRSKEKNITIQFTIDKSLPVVVSGDAVRLRQILINLLLNAVKFSNQGSILIKVTRNLEENDPSNLLFSISDEGIGISPEFHQSIFDRFKQVDTYMTRKYGGSGLGLSICQKLIELMNGRIWVESTLGKGSVFHFTAQLPEVINKHIVMQDFTKEFDQAKHQGDRKSSLHILLVDDSEENRSLIQLFLKNTPHVIFTADNGQEALEVFKRYSFDLILMDVQMPVMDGYTSTREIRKWEIENKRPPTPILAVTAHAFDEDIHNSINAGCTEHITKPLKKGKLLDLIEKYTEK